MVSSQEPNTVCKLGEQSTGCCGAGLRPVTSVATDRYHKMATVQLSHFNVPAGLGRLGHEEMPAYLPEHWAAYVHPEGQLYFCRHSTLVVVTEAYLFNPENMRRLTYWLERIELAMRECEITIHGGVELFLQLEDSGCAYYFIDHLAKTEFWLDSMDTETLGLPQVASEGHLKWALQEHYWAHVEYFPAHFGGLSQATVNELTCILSHAKLDRMTSCVSTFPYTPDECTKYIDLLKTVKDNINDSYTTCITARLWMLISSHRFATHYGQACSRLSRNQRITTSPNYKDNMITRLIPRLTLGLSDIYTTKFEEVFVDDLVYIDQWHRFMKTCTRDWTVSIQASSALLFAHFVYCIIPCITAFSLSSSFFLFASVLSAGLLKVQHRHLFDTSASHAADHLLAIRSETYGFKVAGLVFALPPVLSIFGAAIFVAHGLTLMALHINFGAAAGLAVFMILFSWGIQRALSPKASPRDTRSDDIPEKCEV